MAMKTDKPAPESQTVRRIAVLLGATGGIGSAIASELATPETALFLHGCSRREKLASLAEQLERKAACVETFLTDLTDEKNQNALFHSFDRWAVRFPLEKVDSVAWINASGTDLMTPEMKSISFEERFRRMAALDIVAPVRLAKRFGGWIQEKRPGPRNDSLLFFGWDGVGRGMEGETAQLYSLCKGGIVAFAKSLAQELAPSIRVLTISPGWIETTWGERASERMTRRVQRESLAGRWGRPDEVAGFVAFLVSEKASYLNGQNFKMNGGFDYRR